MEEEVERLKAQVAVMQTRLHDIEQGNGQPGLRDVVKKVFGHEGTVEPGLVAMVEQANASIRSLDAKVVRVFDRVFYVIVGLGMNVLTDGPQILQFIGGIFGGQ